MPVGAANTTPDPASSDVGLVLIPDSQRSTTYDVLVENVSRGAGRRERRWGPKRKAAPAWRGWGATLPGGSVIHTGAGAGAFYALGLLVFNRGGGQRFLGCAGPSPPHTHHVSLTFSWFPVAPPNKRLRSPARSDTNVQLHMSWRSKTFHGAGMREEKRAEISPPGDTFFVRRSCRCVTYGSPRARI